MIHWRRYFSELVGTAALLCAVIGSGIMAEELAGGNMAVALLANTLATVFALYVLIETLGPMLGVDPESDWPGISVDTIFRTFANPAAITPAAPM